MTEEQSEQPTTFHQTTPQLHEAETSASLASLFAALSKAQGQLVAASKDREASIKSDKGAYKYTYATLASVWDACRVPLTSNGLAVIQFISTDKMTVTITTLLTHLSGEWIKNVLSLTAASSTPQHVGSAAMYARRYSLCSLIGVATDDDKADDDGQQSAPSWQPDESSSRSEREDPLTVEEESKCADWKQALEEADTTARILEIAGALNKQPARIKSALRRAYETHSARVYAVKDER